MSNLVTFKGEILQDPPFVQTLLNDPRSAIFWLVLRLYLGWQWIQSAWLQIQDPAWSRTGLALRAFWEQLLVDPGTAAWYQAIVRALYDADAWPWFARLVTYGELVLGIAIVLGLFTGIAAFAGAFVTLNFLMAGSTSLDPILFLIAIGLIMAWKVAGYIGLDFFLLPWLGTPWRGRPMRLLQRELLNPEEPEPSG